MVVTGEAGTGAVGSVSVVAEANVGDRAVGYRWRRLCFGCNRACYSRTGSEGTGAVDSVVVAAAADVGATGSAGTGAVGAVT